MMDRLTEILLKEVELRINYKIEFFKQAYQNIPQQIILPYAFYNILQLSQKCSLEKREDRVVLKYKGYECIFTENLETNLNNIGVV